jgi:hypothetical protein
LKDFGDELAFEDVEQEYELSPVGSLEDEGEKYALWKEEKNRKDKDAARAKEEKMKQKLMIERAIARKMREQMEKDKKKEENRIECPTLFNLSEFAEFARWKEE